MLGHGQLGFLSIGQSPSAQRMLITAIGTYMLTGKALSFVHFVATVQRIKIRVAKPVLYQVRQFLGLLGR